MKRREFLIIGSSFAAGSALAMPLPGLGRESCAVDPSEASAFDGPLRVHPDNPRYFTDERGRAVLLAGSHVWNSLTDMGRDDPPAAFDFDAYLDDLDKHGHNFIRLWAWELTRWDTSANSSRVRKKTPHHVAPHPWERAGPGAAADGKPKFDLTKYNEAFFDRLRSRVIAAGKRGIYVSVMLFEGWGVEFAPGAWDGHPFNARNNVNDIAGDADGDGKGLEVHTLTNPAITRIQEAFVRKVIDTVNDLDNVLYEIANETYAESTRWQYHMIRFIKNYEKKKPKQHPVGMTAQTNGTNQALMQGPADWVSPLRAGGYRDNPPAADGTKVIITDTDHLWGVGGNAAWVWKSVTRGMHPIFMDPYDGVVLGERFDPQWDPIRKAMGNALRLTNKLNLAAMNPRDALASTRYCLAEPGRAYLVYAPKGGKLTVDLSGTRGELTISWFDPTREKSIDSGKIRGDGRTAFEAPFDGPAVLSLTKPKTSD